MSAFALACKVSGDDPARSESADDQETDAGACNLRVADLSTPDAARATSTRWRECIIETHRGEPVVIDDELVFMDDDNR